MILGIGIDVIEIDRFAHWHTYSHAQLQRIFSPAEIAYCMSVSTKSAERFAARFAAREALWKALCQAYPDHTVPFLTLCRAVEVAHSPRGVPYFNIISKSKAPGLSAILSAIALVKEEAPEGDGWNKRRGELSLSHTKTIATAMVILH